MKELQGSYCEKFDFFFLFLFEPVSIITNRSQKETLLKYSFSKECGRQYESIND
jgi:hypothetical protein